MEKVEKIERVKKKIRIQEGGIGYLGVEKKKPNKEDR